jgi:hypothetical protein
MMDKQEAMFIDATPNDDYPLRILEAYRERCNYKWSESSGEINVTNAPIMKVMNDAQDRRAEILDKAIARLRSKS